MSKKSTEKRAAALGDFANENASAEKLLDLSLTLLAINAGIIFDAGEIADTEDFVCVLEQLTAQAVFY